MVVRGAHAKALLCGLWAPYGAFGLSLVVVSAPVFIHVMGWAIVVLTGFMEVCQLRDEVRAEPGKLGLSGVGRRRPGPAGRCRRQARPRQERPPGERQHLHGQDVRRTAEVPWFVTAEKFAGEGDQSQEGDVGMAEQDRVFSLKSTGVSAYMKASGAVVLVIGIGFVVGLIWALGMEATGSVAEADQSTALELIIVFAIFGPVVLYAASLMLLLRVKLTEGHVVLRWRPNLPAVATLKVARD